MTVFIHRSVVGVIPYFALFFNPGMNHLRRQTRCKLSVLTALEQNGYDDIGVPSRSNSNEPTVVFELGGVPTRRLPERIANNLGATRLAGKVNPRQMSGRGSAANVHDAGHRVGDRGPGVRIDTYILHFAIAIQIGRAHV